MTDTTNTETTASKAPRYIAYHVRDRKGQAGIWTPIGAAWPHKTGDGFNLQITMVPLNGLITLRVPSVKPE